MSIKEYTDFRTESKNISDVLSSLSEEEKKLSRASLIDGEFINNKFELNDPEVRQNKFHELLLPNGLHLQIGKISEFPIQEREKVLMWPIEKYNELGYLKTDKLEELENTSNFDPNTIHVIVKDDITGLYLLNVNLVGVDNEDSLEQTLEQHIFPTEQLFEFEIPESLTKVPSNRFQEASRLTSLSKKDLTNLSSEERRGLMSRYGIARHLLAYGASKIIDESNTLYWILNYKLGVADEFVKAVSGLEVLPISKKFIRPESFEGPFAEYLSKYGKDVYPAFIDAKKLSSGIKNVNNSIPELKNFI